MESISIGRVPTLSNANQLLNLIHFLKQLLILPIDELDLAFLAHNFLLSLLMIEVLANSCVAWRSSWDHLQTRDLLITHAHLLIQQEDVVLKLIVQVLELGNLLFEFVTTIVCPSQFFSPNFLGALICAILYLLWEAWRLQVSVFIASQSVR